MSQRQYYATERLQEIITSSAFFVVGLISGLSLLSQLPLFQFIVAAFKGSPIIDLIEQIIHWWRTMLPFPRPEFDTWAFAGVALRPILIGFSINIYRMMVWRTGHYSDGFHVKWDTVLIVSSIIIFLGLNHLLMPELIFRSMHVITLLLGALLGLCLGAYLMSATVRNSGIVEKFLVYSFATFIIGFVASWFVVLGLVNADLLWRADPGKAEATAGKILLAHVFGVTSFGMAISLLALRAWTGPYLRNHSDE